MEKENIRIYNKTDELKLKNVDIDFKNSSMNLGRESPFFPSRKFKNKEIFQMERQD